MTNPLRTRPAQHLGLFLLRLSLGATFLLYGCEKVFRIGISGFVHYATPSIPSFLPLPIGQTYLYAVPFLEMTVGTLMILGLFTRLAGFVAALMLVSFSIAVTGVFTGGDHLHVNYNMVYLAAAVLLAATGPGAISVDQCLPQKAHGKR